MVCRPPSSIRHSTMSSGQQKRRRSNFDAIEGVDRTALKEEDEEEERGIINNDTAKKYLEFFEEDAITTVATARSPASTGTLSNKWERTPIALLLRTMVYMDNDTLMIMCLVCQQIQDLIWSGQGMETNLVRIFALSASKNNNFHEDGLRVRRFLSNMNRYFQNVTKTRILRGFQHGKVQDGYKFNRGDYMEDDDELERLTPNIRMTGIVSLDMSSLPLSIAQYDYSTFFF